MLKTPVPFFYTEDDLLAEVILHLEEMAPPALAALRDKLNRKIAPQPDNP